MSLIPTNPYTADIVEARAEVKRISDAEAEVRSRWSREAKPELDATQRLRGLEEDEEAIELRKQRAMAGSRLIRLQKLYDQTVTYEEILEAIIRVEEKWTSHSKLAPASSFAHALRNSLGVENTDHIKSKVAKAIESLVKDGVFAVYEAEKAPGGRPHGVGRKHRVYGTKLHVAEIEADEDKGRAEAQALREQRERAYDSIVSTLAAHGPSSYTDEIEALIVAAAEHIQRRK